MADPQSLLSMPAGTPTWVAGWSSAIFQYVLAPSIVGILAAWMASRQFRHNVLTERQRAAARLIDELSVFGRRIDERLRFCDKAFKTRQLTDLPILEDLHPPDVREASAVLGPKVAMQHQTLKDAFARSSEEVTYLRTMATNNAMTDGGEGIQALVTFMGPAIEDVLIQVYRTIDYAARAANLPYKQNTRVPLKELEKRKGLRVEVHSNEAPGRLGLMELIAPAPRKPD